ncbi:MAG TPA: metal-dependent transcriptional regulator [Spirochaetota bacterium]|nr:metal-dependent transcriptional regulator [Spirochaetota bacterium]HPC42455.1 metal-dependent transcriptional regulator [Spirochaetota bacterium]HPL15087.1 metal-dependent transcriptional regulator [Spirochaetota bacterium]HQJ70201.1 metal-dependent transcriptional regulator [Spirochaetota bacterium]HRS76915.1 metal-dependent transcriptional regulator [Spirochaetota bacterium]
MEQGKSKYSYRDTGLTPHMEDYVEAIVMLSATNRVVRVKDIAGKLNIKMPSVSAALAKLKEMDLIDYEKYGYVELTEKGQDLAGRVLKRHNCLIDFFSTVLQVEREAADCEACKVEHDLAPETCSQIHKFLDFYKEEESAGSEWVGRLKKALK